MMKSKNRKKGFTLVELLIVTLILGVMLGAIVGCLFAGIRVWESAAKFNRAEKGGLLALELIEKDLVNAFEFYDIGFKGDESGVAFSTLVPDREGGELRRIGTVKYEFDDMANALIRTEWQYPDDEPGKEGQEKLVSNLHSVELAYIFRKDEKGKTTMEELPDCTNFPTAVRIDLVYMDEGQRLNLGRNVVLPVDWRKEEKK